jgi:hypothetical protein
MAENKIAKGSIFSKQALWKNMKTQWIQQLGLATMLAVVFGLAGCESPKPQNAADCSKIDWQREGARRVANGQPVEAAWQGARGAECSANGWPADRVAFDRGYAGGISAYCSPRNGLSQGRADRRYQGICPTVLADEFQRAFDLGRVLQQADTDKSNAESQMARARAISVDDKKSPKEREDARRDLATHQTARDNAQARITSLEAVAAQQGWGLGR